MLYLHSTDILTDNPDVDFWLIGRPFTLVFFPTDHFPAHIDVYGGHRDYAELTDTRHIERFGLCKIYLDIFVNKTWQPQPCTEIRWERNAIGNYCRTFGLKKEYAHLNDERMRYTAAGNQARQEASHFAASLQLAVENHIGTFMLCWLAFASTDHKRMQDQFLWKHSFPMLTACLETGVPSTAAAQLILAHMHPELIEDITALYPFMDTPLSTAQQGDFLHNMHTSTGIPLPTTTGVRYGL